MPTAPSVHDMWKKSKKAPKATPPEGDQEPKAPAFIGKGVFQKDLEYAKQLGFGNVADMFGKKVADEKNSVAVPSLNFGRKSEAGRLPEESRIRLFALKKAISDVEVQAQIKSHQDGKVGYVDSNVMKSVPAYKQILAPMMKAFNLTDFSDWIDTVQARFFFEEYEIPHLLMDQFDTLPMSSGVTRVPGSLGLLEGQLEADDGTFAGQFNSQASYTVEAKGNVVHQLITQDLLDDSSPPLIDKMRKEALKGIVRAYEKALLNGTATGTTHIDADTEAGSAKLFTKAFHGLRYRAFNNPAEIATPGTTVYNHGGDSASKLLFASLLKLMGKQSSEKSDLIWAIPTAIAHDLVTGAIPELFTAFAFGGLASNVTGQVPPVFGVQGVESQHLREDLAATGKALADPSSSTTTCMLLIQRSRFQNWLRQATRVWAAPSLPSSDLMLMTAKARHAFDGFPQSATEKSVVMGININAVP